MNDLISACRRNFHEAPRRFSFWARRGDLRLPLPDYLVRHPEDRLNLFFEHYWDTLEHGEVVWGHVIQANDNLFTDGSYDHPGEVVYSLEDSDKVDPRELARVARQLYALKGQPQEQEGQARIADYLADEMERVFGLRVPMAIGNKLRYRISTTYFVRKHLPQKRLCASLFPIVVRPSNPFVVVVLPSAYWPEALLKRWDG